MNGRRNTRHGILTQSEAASESVEDQRDRLTAMGLRRSLYFLRAQDHPRG